MAHGEELTAKVRRSLALGAVALVLFAGLVATALAASTDFRQFNSSPEVVGPNPQAIVAADLDGDTDQDLATVNISGGNVTILRNKGTGNLTEPNSSPIPAGSFPNAIAAADLDGDGDVDLAVTNQVSEDVTILRNKGTGKFTQPGSSPEPAGDTPAAIAAADLDGDTDVDLAVANLLTAGQVTMLLNNGSGKFSESPSSPESVGNHPTSVVAADLNGDGDQDLAVTNQQNASVSILRNAGIGDFTQPGSSPELTDLFPQDIVSGQLDADNDPDLAVATQGNDRVTILLNVGGHDFDEPLSSPETVGDRPLSLAAADFDLDGDDDLAVPTQMDDHVTILENDGSGDLIEPASSPEAVGDAPREIAAADLDGDTDADVAIVGQPANVTILRNR